MTKEISSTHHYRHFALRLPRRLHRNLHVLSERGEKLHQAADRELSGTVAHQRRDVGLPDAEDFAGLRLRQAALLDDLVDLQRQAGLEQLLLGIRQAEISEHVAAAP